MKGNGHHIHELTRIEAFLLSEKAGHPSHMHDHFWTQAEAFVRQRIAIVKGAVKSTKSKGSVKAKPVAAALPVATQEKPVAKATKKAPASQPTPSEAAIVATSKPKAASPAKKKVAPAKKKSPKSV